MQTDFAKTISKTKEEVRGGDGRGGEEEEHMEDEEE
jgi:hypothetical protein